MPRLVGPSRSSGRCARDRHELAFGLSTAVVATVPGPAVTLEPLRTELFLFSLHKLMRILGVLVIDPTGPDNETSYEGGMALLDHETKGTGWKAW